MPSSNIDNCAGVSATVPLVACGHVNFPRWILFECCLHHATQTCKSTPQIRYSCGDPDPRSCCQRDHPSKHSSTVRSASASTLPVTRSCPFGSLISIDPTANGEDA